MGEGVKDTAEVVKGVLEAVPVYQDAIQPAAKQVGQALETVARAINVALTPVSAFVWGFDRIRDFVLSRVAEKLQSVPPDRIVTPNPLIAGPTLEALRYAGHEESLRELYANLLATSLDSETAISAHPSFVGIIGDMSPDEARIMQVFSVEEAFPVVTLLGWNKKEVGGYKVVVRNFSLVGRKAGCVFPDMTPSYLDNLCRLGLLEIPAGVVLIEPGTYEALENDPELEPFKAAATMKALRVDFERRGVRRTTFGIQFCEACVIQKPTAKNP